jgi:hypothetical protein
MNDGQWLMIDERFDHQPSIINHRSSSIDHRSSIIVHQPSFIDHSMASARLQSQAAMSWPASSCPSSFQWPVPRLGAKPWKNR